MSGSRQIHRPKLTAEQEPFLAVRSLATNYASGYRIEPHHHPWSQFLYAEGGDDQVRLAFTTHDVLVSGSQLGSLLADLSGHRVSLLREPVRAEKFRHEGGAQITGVSVRKVE